MSNTTRRSALRTALKLIPFGIGARVLPARATNLLMRKPTSESGMAKATDALTIEQRQLAAVAGVLARSFGSSLERLGQQRPDAALAIERAWKAFCCELGRCPAVLGPIADEFSYGVSGRLKSDLDEAELRTDSRWLSHLGIRG